MRRSSRIFGATSISDYHGIFAFRRNINWKKSFNQGKTGKRQNKNQIRTLRTFKVVFNGVAVRQQLCRNPPTSIRVLELVGKPLQQYHSENDQVSFKELGFKKKINP